MHSSDISIKVELMNGEVRTFSFGQSVGFQFMQQGVFFTQSPDKIETKGPEKNPTEKTVRYERTWIPLVNIKSVTVIDKNTLTGEDIEKYDAFMQHNVDITKNPISHTEGLKPAEIEKMLMELKVNKEKEKVASVDSQDDAKTPESSQAAPVDPPKPVA